MGHYLHVWLIGVKIHVLTSKSRRHPSIFDASVAPSFTFAVTVLHPIPFSDQKL